VQITRRTSLSSKSRRCCVELDSGEGLAFGYPSLFG
ncbi:hypothetical protein A2U01_0112650, partial [Trifolium medium]|nr:hypothetical protein [Trifolium medium]